MASRARTSQRQSRGADTGASVPSPHNPIAGVVPLDHPQVATRGHAQADASGRDHGHPGGLIRFERRVWPVIDSIRLGGRTYDVLEHLSGDHRLLVFDRRAMMGGDLRVVTLSDRTARSRLRLIERVSRSRGDLPRIYDVGARRERLYVVAEWVRGQTLASYLDECRAGAKPRIGPDQAFWLLRRLVHQLARLHRESLYHLDVRPANLIVKLNTNDIRLIDFGHAWHPQRMMERPERTLETDAYAAPEVHAEFDAIARHHATTTPPDFRADQFSAASCIYEALTLRMPHNGLGGLEGRWNDTPSALMPASKSDPGSQWPRPLWKMLDAFLERSLAPDAARRYRSPAEWVDAIERIYVEVKRREGLSWLDQALDGVAHACSRLAVGFRRLTRRRRR